MLKVERIESVATSSSFGVYKTYDTRIGLSPLNKLLLLKLKLPAAIEMSRTSVLVNGYFALVVFNFSA